MDAVATRLSRMMAAADYRGIDSRFAFVALFHKRDIEGPFVRLPVGQDFASDASLRRTSASHNRVTPLGRREVEIVESDCALPLVRSLAARNTIALGVDALDIRTVMRERRSEKTGDINELAWVPLT